MAVPTDSTKHGSGSAGAAAPSRAQRLASEISAYPGTITFQELIRKNKRQSVVLIATMLVLIAALGAALGMVVVVYGQGGGGGGDAGSLIPAAILGGVVAIVIGSAGASWSWMSGSNAILRMMHAREISPEDDAQLYNVVDELRIAAGLPMPRVFLIEDSALNAFATGRDPAHAAVAITRGLREKLPRDELQAVLAHEMSHVRHLDIRFSMLMATMVGLIVFACDAFWRMIWYSGMGGVGGVGRRGRRSGGRSDGNGAIILIVIVIAVILSIVAPIIARIIQMSYSRQVANRGTAHMFIANPLKKMRQAHNNLDSLFASHPPMDKRIARILALMR